jgi:hypothetical protein
VFGDEIGVGADDNRNWGRGRVARRGAALPQKSVSASTYEANVNFNFDIFNIALYRTVCYGAPLREPKNSFHPTSLDLPFIIALWW